MNVAVLNQLPSPSGPKCLDPRALLRIARPLRNLVGHLEALRDRLAVAKRQKCCGGSKDPIQ